MSAKAQEMMDDYLDLFEVPVVDSSIEHKEYAVYFDDNSEVFTGPRSNAYVIRTKDLNSFLDMRNAFLEVEVSSNIGTVAAVPIVTGVAQTATLQGIQLLPAVATQNNVSVKAANIQLGERLLFSGETDTAIIMKNAWSLFNNVRYTINDITIEDISEPQECSDMRLFSKLSPDSAKVYSNMNFYNPMDLTPDNWFLDHNADKIRCVMPLTSLLGSVESSKLCRGLKHSLYLTPQNNLAQILQSLKVDNETGTYESLAVGPDLTNVSVYISRLRLWVPIAQPSLKAVLDYDREIDAGSSTIRLFEGMRHYFSQPSTSAQQNWYVHSEDQHIKRVYVWVMTASAETSYTAKNFLRGVAGLSSIKLRINSEILPREELSFDLSTNSRDAHRAHQMYLDAIKKSQWDTDNEPVLDFESWFRRQQIFCFAIPQRYDAFDNKQSDINVEVRFSSVPASYVIHAVIETENQMMINGSDNRISLGLTRENLLGA
jgi:hypothetical protein